MTVILVLFTFTFFLLLDHFTSNKKTAKTFIMKGTTITTHGFEALGALAQDGGKPVEKRDKN